MDRASSRRDSTFPTFFTSCFPVLNHHHNKRHYFLFQGCWQIMRVRMGTCDCWYVLHCEALSSLWNIQQRPAWLQTLRENSTETHISLHTRSACVFVFWLNTEQTYCAFKIIIKQNRSSALSERGTETEVLLCGAFASGRTPGWWRTAAGSTVPRSLLIQSSPWHPEKQLTPRSFLSECKSSTKRDHYRLDKEP